MSPGPPRSGFLVPVLGASYGQIVNLIAKTNNYESLKIQFYIKNTSNALYIKKSATIHMCSEIKNNTILKQTDQHYL